MSWRKRQAAAGPIDKLRQKKESRKRKEKRKEKKKREAVEKWEMGGKKERFSGQLLEEKGNKRKKELQKLEDLF
jgi:hypothetical protein